MRLNVAADAPLVDIAWSFLERPAGSATAFTLPDNAPTSFVSNGALGFDVAGAYVVAAAVVDDLGAAGTCEIALDVGPALSPPTCVARVKSVNGVEVTVGSTPEVAPLDDVVLSLDQSVAGAGSIASFSWSLLERPAGGTAQLTSSANVDTGFTFDGDLGIDVAGTYSVRGRVQDDLGQGNDCEITFEVIPADALFVQLTWDTPENDLDLHVEHDGIDCSAIDCHATWGGDAHLESDTSGFGPETFGAFIEGPMSIAIRVVSTAESESDTGATIRVFVDGRFAYEGFANVSVGETWEPVRVEWPAAAGALPCVEDLGDGIPDDECP